jgi:hypothetical protein
MGLEEDVNCLRPFAANSLHVLAAKGAISMHQAPDNPLKKERRGFSATPFQKRPSVPPSAGNLSEAGPPLLQCS